MKRSEAREYAFKLIYEAAFQTDKELVDLVADTEDGQEFSANDYIKNTLAGVMEKREELDEILAAHAKGWKLARISSTSGAILRLAIYEMLYSELHFSIVINEAVEIAKKYDHEKAPKFINGILNAIAETKGLKPKKAEATENTGVTVTETKPENE